MASTTRRSGRRGRRLDWAGAGWSLARPAARDWLFLVPALVFFIGYQVWPIFRVLWLSFTDFHFLRNKPAQLGWVRNYATRWPTR